MRNVLIVLFSVLIFYRCIDKGPEKAQVIIDKAIAAHGGTNFTGSTVSFEFRDMIYTAIREPDAYTYSRQFINQGDTITDLLNNSAEFIRILNGDTVSLHDTTQTKYANSVNSVLYFVQLPYLLNDPAVNKKYQGTTTIAGSTYEVVKVTFDAQGGGEDHQDEYMYWINQNSNMLDYLAYNYQTDGGGVRFREAYNRLERGGIIFQDYINYEAPMDVPLDKLPELLGKGELKELSRIENENIQVEKM